MYNLFEVAKFIINFCIDNEFNLDIRRLENILIVLQGAYLSKFGKRLFAEKIIVKAGIVSIYNFKEKHLWLDQKYLMSKIFSQEEEHLIEKVLQDIFKEKINIYLTNNNNGIILILSDEEIKNIFKKQADQKEEKRD